MGCRRSEPRLYAASWRVKLARETGGNEDAMTMTRRTKIIVIAVIAIIFGPMFYGCGRVEWKHSRVKPGMTVAQVLEVADGWWMCTANSEGQKPEEAQRFWLAGGDGRYSIHLSGANEGQPVDSQAEMIRLVEKRMSDGHPWRVSFSYFASVPPRIAFAVEFDAQGRVTSVGDTVGAD